MKKVVVDSCVFFDMIQFNDVYINVGEEAFFDYIKASERVLEKRKSEISALLDPEFLEQYKDFTFDKQLDCLEIYNINKINSLKNEIKKTHSAKQRLIHTNGNPGEIKRLQTMWENLQEKLAQAEFNAKSLEDKKNTYKVARNSLYAGKLLAQSIKGEIELCVTTTGYDEIENHIIENNTGLTRAMYHEESVDNLTKNHFTLITVKDPAVERIVRKLAQVYRTAVLAGSPMKNDINANGVYGDSLIMAESNLAGISLVTINEKDFIFDENLDNTKTGIRNEARREHIDAVNQRLAPTTSDALPISLHELINNDHAEPNRQSEDFALVYAINKNEKFKEEVEIKLNEQKELIHEKTLEANDLQKDKQNKKANEEDLEMDL